MARPWQFEKQRRMDAKAKLQSKKGTGLTTRLGEAKIEPRVVEYDRALKSMKLRYYGGERVKEAKQEEV